MSDAFLHQAAEIVGARHCLTTPEAMAPYLAEERGSYQGRALLVARPGSTEEVAKLVALCARHGVGIVPQGGNTGLCGGAVPENGQIVIALARLDRVLALDAANRTLTVEAGCVLAAVQAEAETADLLFPLSLAAQGSCQIGGNLSTNAGGTGVLRYGNARELVLGLEVVLADGQVWNGLRGLRKDNTGYDLKQLFLGAEGTLGIITAATLKLFPRPRDIATAWVGFEHPARLIELLGRLEAASGAAVTACELIPRLGLDFVLAHIPDTKAPLKHAHAWHGLIELSSPRPDGNLSALLEETLGMALADGLIADATLADSLAKAAALWRLRESLPAAQKPEGASLKHDVAVPLSALPDFLAQASEAVESSIAGVRVCAFGHIGDGNIHFNLSQPRDMSAEAFLKRRDAIANRVHDLAMAMGGSFSAEHGIGRLKRPDMARYKAPVELDLMRRMKAALDPQGIMNPGKVVG
jgi:FAD/FMN-containing dehydrogenase